MQARTALKAMQARRETVAAVLALHEAGRGVREIAVRTGLTQSDAESILRGARNDLNDNA